MASRPPAEALDFGELGPFLSGYTSRRVFFTYCRCPGCGMLYCPVYLTQSQLDLLYRHQPENMGEAPLAARRRTQAQYFDILKRRSRLAGPYLELGCDIGLFVELCLRGGRFSHYWLYEPNERVHGSLAERLTGCSYTLRTSVYSAGDIARASVSTAVLIHVLDHVLSPREMLRSIGTALEPGGVLFVVTHDVESILARMLGRRWPPYTLQHPHLFGPATIRRLMEDAGFEVMDIVKTANCFPVSHLLRAALSVLGVGAGLVPAWEAPMLRVRLGNIATVARKV